MSPKQLTAFRIEPEVMAALREVKAREGLPIAVQVDFALRDWLRRKRVAKAPRKPAARRRA
jgi:hypothetical protein